MIQKRPYSMYTYVLLIILYIYILVRESVCVCVIFRYIYNRFEGFFSFKIRQIITSCVAESQRFWKN